MRDIAEGYSLGTQHNRFPLLFNNHFRALEAKGLEQAHRLAASVFENLGRFHIYEYLHFKKIKYREAKRYGLSPVFT
jgi:hypothetical protein